MELHGGSISVTSEGIGKGSCFSVEIPVAFYQATSLRNSVATVNGSELMSTSVLSQLASHCFNNILEFDIHRFYMAKNTPKSAKVIPFNGVSPSHSLVPTDPKLTTGVQRNLSGRYVDKVVEPISERSLIDIAHVCAVRDGINEKEEDDNVAPRIKLSNFRRVLIVDDVAMNRKMLKRLFVTRFEECDEAGDGQQAVDMVKESIASGSSYDIITIDYQMPVMDGVTATSIIRKLGYKGQIIGVTGNALSEDVNSFLSNGADTVLTKPLSIAAFDKYMNSRL